MLGVAVEGRLLGLNGGMGEKIVSESAPFGGYIWPSREERIGVVIGRWKGTFESAGIFLLQDLADLSI